jgi:hypothetical protein
MAGAQEWACPPSGFMLSPPADPWPVVSNPFAFHGLSLRSAKQPRARGKGELLLGEISFRNGSGLLRIRPRLFRVGREGAPPWGKGFRDLGCPFSVPGPLLSAPGPSSSVLGRSFSVLGSSSSVFGKGVLSLRRGGYEPSDGGLRAPGSPLSAPGKYLSPPGKWFSSLRKGVSTPWHCTFPPSGRWGCDLGLSLSDHGMYPPQVRIGGGRPLDRQRREE